MKVVFVKTNASIPEVNVYPVTTKIEETVDANDKTWLNVTHTVSGVSTITVIDPVDGELAIFWE